MSKRDFSTFFLYVLAFFLLWEWLRPVEQLTTTHNIKPFVVFLLISFLVSFLNLKWIWRSSIQSVYILFSIHQFYYHVSILNFSWLMSFIIDLKQNVFLLFIRNWNNFTYEFRTLLFFVLLWIMVYLIQYWLLRRQRIFLFFFMTLVYITVLDTFTSYSAKVAIVRTVIVGFMVMGMLTFLRMIQKDNVSSHPSRIRSWMSPLAGMIAVSVLVGIAAPKAGPIWPDPTPYFKAESTKAIGNIGVKRIGYGVNDTQLGGPFIGDDNPVFFYQGDNKNYWKVETKDVYTGKGWIPSGSTTMEFTQGDLAPVYPILGSVKTVQATARVNPVDRKSAPFIYPAGIQKIHDITPKLPANQRFSIDTNTEKFMSFYNTWYFVDYKIPQYEASDLRKTMKFDPAFMDQTFYKRYTQVPRNLPARVKQLTEQITADQNNWFDKAKAVERFFASNGYTYDQKRVAIPSEKQDYVDQFLFETKRGYCDNFSSAMAVMLRTIGIPTRWVKGYTGGEFLKYNNGDISKKIFKITNNNAHSWVEVFFPNQGWVPFEPTVGFPNDTFVNYGSEGQAITATQKNIPIPQVKREQKVLQENNSTLKSPNNTIKTKKMLPDMKTYLKEHWKRIIFFLILVNLLVAVLYWIRGKWVPYWLIVVYRFRKKDENLADAYLVLLKQFNRYGLKRKENQTLRSYAVYIDQFFSTGEMTRLTVVYEQYLYHQQLPEGVWQETHELWENLIKRTIA